MRCLTARICGAVRIRTAVCGVGVLVALSVRIAIGGLRGCVGRARGSGDGEIKASGLGLLWYQGASLHTGGQAHLRSAIGPTGVEFCLRSNRYLRIRHDECIAMPIGGDTERSRCKVADEHPHGLPGALVLSLLTAVYVRLCKSR